MGKLSAAVVLALLGSLAPVPAYADGDPGCTFEEAFTPFDTTDGDNPVVMQTGRVVELRASNKTKCAWGRLSSGTPGEEIWTDRRRPDGSEYEGFLGYTRIDSGDAKYTDPFSNDGKVMRACGSSHGIIECTGWF
ncbi:hypothetical protein Lesp02_61950 [Lentzea sp. NBRC 105346]|uniref:hypothetical protein n=1 Tax=Lentzea sp. NBRC 105346 TaxID=3032205 RepID=UPI002556E434|nr:hypothetical protein [Lentzea sp. NBRC 105346]GLZ34007.1 hypothetical protein Lesp02_61950 [Lentzea sp. NBRC 105346]